MSLSQVRARLTSIPHFEASRCAVEIDGDDLAYLRSRQRPDFTEGSNPVNVVDLFAGCGALTLGVAQACRRLGRALHLRLAAEFQDEIARVYRANFPMLERGPRGDVRELFAGKLKARRTRGELALHAAIAPVDILIGGPPCQGHSSLNNHTRGTDEKNELYDRMVRAAQVLEARNVIIENVPAIRRDQKAVLDRSVERLERLGYKIAHDVVNVHRLGVPQTRLRHVLLASVDRQPDLARAVFRCEVQVPRDVAWAIKDLDEQTIHTRIDTPAVLSPENLARARFLHAQGLFNLPNDRRPPCHRDKEDHSYLSMYGRLAWELPAQTITTGFSSPGQGRYLHPSRLRTITPHEAARLQFLPDWYDFAEISRRTVLAEAIGNAVPPKLSFALALELLESNTVMTEACRM